MVDDFARRIFLPYCLQRLADGRYIVLNRLYKPLGIASREWIEYETHPSALPIKGITAKKAIELSHKGSDDLNKIFLYADACLPTSSAQHWDAFSKRLKLLAELKIG